MDPFAAQFGRRLGRTPHGVRGLKFTLVDVLEIGDVGRTPHGVRGLKYAQGIPRRRRRRSHPSRGAWIEIECAQRGTGRRPSHPSRGAWIEILDLYNCWGANVVAPLTGCVD